MDIAKAVTLAAGRGTRMKSLTDDIPKPMLPLRGKPMLAHQVEAMEKAGIRRVLIVTGYRAEIVEEYFAAHPPARAEVSFQRQQHRDGTGSAARLAREFVAGEAFLLTFGDILVDSSVYASLFAKLEGADGALAVKQVDDPYRGAAVYVEDGRVTKIIEKPPKGSSQTRWNNAGVYAFRPPVFDELERIPLSARGEYELTDAIRGMLGAGAVIRPHSIEGFWRDVGRPEDLDAASDFVGG